VQSRPEPRAGFLFGHLRPDELCQNEAKRLVLRVSEAKAFNDSVARIVIFWRRSKILNESKAPLRGHCIFIVNGYGNSGSVQRNRWDERRVVDEREPRQPRFDMPCSL
jgi:hypothetical protein